MEITAVSEDRQEAADIANAVAEAYRDYRLADRLDLAKKGIGLLKEELDEKEKEIQALEAQVNQLRKDLEINDIDPSSGKMLGAYDQETLRGIERLRIEAEAEYLRYHELYTQLKDLPREELKRRIPTANPDPILQSLLEKLAEAEQKKAALEPDYSKDHPEMQRITKMLETLNQQVDDRLKGLIAGLATRVASFQKECEGLQSKLAEAKAKERIAAEKMRPYLSAKEDLDLKRQVKQALTLHISQAEVDNLKMHTDAAMTLVDRAEPGLRPVRPNKPLNLTLGILSGLVLGFITGGAGWLLASRRRG